jgi:hypothetical protein
MSTPEAGGATVFPSVRVAQFPSRNDALFWCDIDLGDAWKVQDDN